MRYLHLGSTRASIAKLVRMMRMVKREFHTAYMDLVPVLNDDDGRLGMLSKMP